jgi:uncharacterized membrane protein YjjB (DUF3815 family)
LVTTIVSSAGWAANHFTGLKFPLRADITSAFGALTVGILANVYGRFFQGTSFVVMVSLPSSHCHRRSI